jgi:hypothetical protein
LVVEHFYQGASVDLSAYPAAASNEVYVIHGDILNDARCHMAIFGHGHKPDETSIGSGGWRLVKLTGSDQQITNTLITVQNGAAQNAGANGATNTCPVVASIGWG